MATPDADFASILVPVDGSPLAEQALPYAAALASKNTTIRLLLVLRDPEPVRDLLGRETISREDVLNQWRDAATASLHQLAERTRQYAGDLVFDVEVTVGDPAEQILKVAQERGIDLIVMTSHGRGAAGRMVYGSVADRVMRNAPLPVMMIRPEDAAPERGVAAIRRLVVPLDGSAVAAQALPVAKQLARHLHTPVQLVSVIDVYRDLSPAAAYGMAFSQQIYDEMETYAKQQTQQMLMKAAEHVAAGDVAVSWTVLSGPTAPAIMDTTRPGDIIVLTSHGRGGLKRWLIGSVAEKLMRESPAPLVLLRAKDAGDSESGASE
ncbi:MAG TPA: universal stress protein [Thermomicrobiales bacterium]|nr:universal stress protein [Thermomicrobiales bacterium]